MIKKLLLSAIVLMLYTASSYAQVAVIVNKSVSASSLSAAKLLDIYSLSTKDWGGSKVVVYDRKSDDDTKSKFYNYVGKPAAEMKKVWMRVQLAGEGKAPEALASDDEIVKKVASTPGAIGYVSADKVTGDVKVVATIK